MPAGMHGVAANRTPPIECTAPTPRASGSWHPSGHPVHRHAPSLRHLVSGRIYSPSRPFAADSGKLAFPQVEDWDSARFFCAAMYSSTEQRISGDYRLTCGGLRETSDNPWLLGRCWDQTFALGSGEEMHLALVHSRSELL